MPFQMEWMSLVSQQKTFYNWTLQWQEQQRPGRCRIYERCQRRKWENICSNGTNGCFLRASEREGEREIENWRTAFSYILCFFFLYFSSVQTSWTSIVYMHILEHFCGYYFYCYRCLSQKESTCVHAWWHSPFSDTANDNNCVIGTQNFISIFGWRKIKSIDDWFFFFLLHPVRKLRRRKRRMSRMLAEK